MVSDFSEKYLFLKSFQGLTLTLAVSGSSDLTPEALNVLVGVLQDLQAHRVKVILLSHRVEAVGEFLESLDTRMHGHCHHLVLPDNGGVPPALWRWPASLNALGVEAADLDGFLGVVARLGSDLRLPRILLLDRRGSGDWRDGQGQPLSFVNFQRLKRLTGEGIACGEPDRCRLYLRAVHAMLSGGVGAVSLCRLRDLATELFSYAGEGVFFSRRHYCQVRRLTLDDFEQAAAIIRRGEEEGFLLTRSDEDLTGILMQGFGAFISAHHLAGVCGLVTAPYAAENVGEITALYALTRFHGEGVGGRLIARVVQEARWRRLSALFACVGDPRAAEFFLRLGFRQVGGEDLPAAKWRHYDPVRRARVLCFFKELPKTARE